MDPLTIALIAQTILGAGSGFLQHRRQGKQENRQDQASALRSVIQGLSPQRAGLQGGGVGQVQQMPNLGQAIDPLVALLRRRADSAIPDPNIIGEPRRDQGALAVQNISRMLGR